MPINTLEDFIAPFDHAIRQVLKPAITLDYTVCAGNSGLDVIRVTFDDGSLAETFVKEIINKLQIESKSNAIQAKTVQSNSGAPCVYFDKDEVLQLVQNSLTTPFEQGNYLLFKLTVGDNVRLSANYYPHASAASISSNTIKTPIAKSKYNIPHASKFKDIAINPNEQAVMDLIKAHNAVVRVVDTSYSVSNQTVTYKNVNLDWNITQIADPNKVRPSRYQKYKPMAAKITVNKVNPATGTVASFTVGLGRERPHKGNDYVYTHTKKHPSTIMSPSPQYQLLAIPVGTVFLWDFNDCHLKEGRYQFTSNAATFGTWWLNATSVGIRSVSVDVIRQHNLNGTANNPVYHNEVLYGYPAKKINALGARYVKRGASDETALNDRINTLRVMYYSKKVVGLDEDIPIICFQNNQPHHVYTPLQRIEDVNDTLEHTRSAAYAILSDNNFELLQNIIESSLYRLPAHHTELNRLLKNCTQLKIDIAAFTREVLEARHFTDPTICDEIFTRYYCEGRLEELLARAVELFCVEKIAKHPMLQSTSFAWNNRDSNSVIFEWLLTQHEFSIALDFIERVNGQANISFDSKKHYQHIAAISQDTRMPAAERIKLCCIVYFDQLPTQFAAHQICTLIIDKDLDANFRKHLIKDIFASHPIETRCMMLSYLTENSEFDLIQELVVTHALDQLTHTQLIEVMQPTLEALLNSRDEMQIQAAFKCEPIIKYILYVVDGITTDNQVFLFQLLRYTFEAHQFDIALNLLLLNASQPMTLSSEVMTALIVHLRNSRPNLLHEIVTNNEYPLFNLLCLNQTAALATQFYAISNQVAGKDIFQLCLAKREQAYIKSSVPLMQYLPDERKNKLFAQLVFAGYMDEALNLLPSITKFTANHIVNDLGRNIFHYLVTKPDLLEQVLTINTYGIEKRDFNNISPLHLALRRRDLAVGKLLFTNGQQPLDEPALSQLMLLASGAGDYALCANILETSFSLDTFFATKDASGNNCLHTLLNALHGETCLPLHINLIKEIVRRCPELLTEENHQVLTPVELALSEDNFSVAFKRELLNLINPLHIKANAATRILLKLHNEPQLYDLAPNIINNMQVDVKQMDVNDNTALHVYVSHGDAVDIVTALCKLGADPLMVNKDGDTVLDKLISAMSYGSPDHFPNYHKMLKILCQHLPQNMLAAGLPTTTQAFWNRAIQADVLHKAIQDLDVALIHFLSCVADGGLLTNPVVYAVAKAQEDTKYLPVLLTMLRAQTVELPIACAADAGEVFANYDGITLTEICTMNIAGAESRNAFLIGYADAKIKTMQTVPEILSFMTQMQRIYDGSHMSVTSLTAFWQQYGHTSNGKHILKMTKNQMLSLVNAGSVLTPAQQNNVEALLAINTGMGQKTSSMRIYRLFTHTSVRKQQQGQVQLQKQIDKNDHWINKRFHR